MRVIVIEQQPINACAAMPAVGVVGETTLDLNCPEGKVPVKFDPVDLGYEPDPDADPVILYLPQNSVREYHEMYPHVASVVRPQTQEEYDRDPSQGIDGYGQW
jgi:hypothetical protein